MTNGAEINPSTSIHFKCKRSENANEKTESMYHSNKHKTTYLLSISNALQM